MPIQIIEEAPGFGSLFGAGLAKGLRKNKPVQAFFEAMQQRQFQEKQAQDLANADQMLEKNYGIQLSGLKDPKLRELIISEALKGKNQRDLEEFKSGQKNQENQKSKDITQQAFNRIGELISDVGLSNAPWTPFGGKSAEASGEFSSLTGALESHLVEMVNKGTLSNTRFKYITETLLPKPSDTQASIRGKMKGIAQMLDLDPSILDNNGKRSNNKKMSLEEIFQ